MSYDVVESQTFWDCVMSMRRDDGYHAALMETLIELRRQPFRNPVLQTHDVGNAKNGQKIFSSDVGGRKSDRRLIWQLFNKTVVVLLYGTHAYRTVRSGWRSSSIPAERVVTVIEQAPDSGVERDYREQRVNVGRLFMAWTNDELSGFGFPDHVVEVLRKLNNDDELFELEESLGDELFELAFNLLATGSPDGESPARGRSRRGR